MRFEPFEIERVKREADLVALIGADTRLRRAGRLYSGCCPLHGDKNPSLQVDPVKNTFRCHSTACGAAGSAIDYVMLRDGLSFSQAVEALGGEAAAAPRSAADKAAQAQRKQARQERWRQKRQAQDEQAARDAAKERARAQAIWQQGAAFTGSPAETYLREVRALGGAALQTQVLRYHPALPFWHAGADGTLRIIHQGPAMLAAFQRRDGRFAALHMTWLDLTGPAQQKGKARIVAQDGSVLPAKKIRGPFMGSAIRLSPPALTMSLGEGIETCGAAIASGCPAWVAGTLGNLTGRADATAPREPHPARPGKLLPARVPDYTSACAAPAKGCKTLIYLADSDTADLHVLRALLAMVQARAARAGIAASSVWPPAGMDLADWFIKEKTGRAA
ncbi:CHC2 zinc finger domain-containing protein [Polycladidibacter hongkongensis]|uniref:CHC2 zinc finger domain-containing protein n=1 Tax=Polycladidibacter hongkongensis TaxID=1647556 RepID=UPI00082F352A|nr:CHC2 zinc finger domain-containing protein [Pseudovibrio hongkongensis]